MAARLGYPVFDADYHLYAPQEALLAHLPRNLKALLDGAPLH